MKRSNSLRRPIVVAYLLFALISSAFFAIIAGIAVEGIETRLVDERLEDVAMWASPRYAGKLPVEMPAGMSFHHGADIPLSLRNLPPGVQEKTVDGVDLHLLVGQDENGDYVVVDHDSEYEKIELVVYSLFALGFLGFLGCSAVLGTFVANRIIVPIMQLAGAVEQRKPDLPLQERKDELGLLARSFAGHTGELTRFLDRERFFTGDVSHELRTPLTVISGAAEVLMAQTRDQPQLHAPAERIYRAAREAAESVSVLLRLARSPEVLEWASLSAAAMAQDEVARYQHLVAGRPLILDYLGGEDFAVRAPRELLVAAIGNLIRNACQYTERGAVRVSLGAQSIIVEDTGPGLPPAALAALRNEPMPAEARGSSGTGLGLALVQRISAYLGADLQVSEGADGGTRFELRFRELLTKS
ncbi:sensor histidine kinase [Pseudoduganella violacea]|uniref:histidine kinase n=1 Tax=Pseudoduganella violacea TaxID=1715466 RepID=A0A7W5BHP6_9BURK|nr:HAMP domain-containing sensor histidine kinase [Pseudoduganella violacea]MBB3122430.1 signal transduction histidine kinase [Pseudoduganella violacea]